MNAFVHLQRAQAAFDVRQFDVARREALSAAADEPTDPRPHLVLGRINLHSAQMPAAREHAEEAIRLAPNWFGGHWLLGWAWVLDRGSDIPGNLTGPARPRVIPARAAAQTSLSLAPDDESNHLLLGVVEFEDDKCDLALKHFEDGLAINPENAELLRWRGRVLTELGRLGQAERSYLEALRVHPDDHDTQYFLARQYASQGRFKVALPHIREFMRNAPDSQEGSELYWEMVKTQHFLLQGVVWLTERSKPLRRWASWWIVGTMLIGIPLIIALGAAMKLKEPPTVLLLVFAAVVVLPWINDVLSPITDALWLWLGRDKERPLQNWVDRLATIETAIGIASLPIAALISGLSGSPIAFFWVWGAICIAVLHNLGIRCERPMMRYLLFAAALVWFAGMMMIAFLPAPADEPEKWHMLHMVASVIVAASTGYVFHREKQK